MRKKVVFEVIFENQILIHSNFNFNSFKEMKWEAPISGILLKSAL